MKILRKIAGWFYLIYLGEISIKESWEKFSMAFRCLSFEQIDAVLEIIDAEIAKSFCFGLYLSKKHRYEEKLAILSILEKTGNVHLIPKNYGDFEDARRLFAEALFDLLADNVKFYFEKLKKERKVATMYNCHLTSVMTEIVRAIYDKKAPFDSLYSKRPKEEKMKVLKLVASIIFMGAAVTNGVASAVNYQRGNFTLSAFGMGAMCLTGALALRFFQSYLKSGEK